MSIEASALALYGAVNVGVYAFGAAFLVSRHRPLADQRRQLSWLLTTFAALVVTVVGSYYAFGAWWQGVSSAVELYRPSDPMQWLRPSGGGAPEEPVSRHLCLFFLAYCGVDSVLGALHYPEQIDVGYYHHALYSVLLCYLLHTRQTLLFAICGVEELPTLLVGGNHLLGDGGNPRFGVGVVFFLTRVSYHCWITARALDRLDPLLYWVSSVLLITHVGWFQSYLAKGSLPSKRQSRAAARVATGGSTGMQGGASAGPLHERALWSMATRHLLVFVAMLVGQALLHSTLTARVLRAAMQPPAADGERGGEWCRAAAWAAYVCVGNLLVVAYTVRRLARALRDVYTANFISDSLVARRIIYNISWEDPAVEVAELRLGQRDVILTIASAGCNVLDYLIEKPAGIVAADLNEAQLALLDLKLASLAALDHAAFFALWARSDAAVFEASYAVRLRPLLQLDSSRAFWDTNGELFASNLFFAGSAGFGARLLRLALRGCGALDAVVRGMRRGQAPDPRGWGMRIFTLCLSQMWLWRLLAPLGGVPTSQIDLLRRTPSVWISRVCEVFGSRMWRADNYFYYAYAVGRWDPHCCPRYLRPEHYEALRSSAHRVALHHGPLASAAASRDDFTVASLLDSMDWMGDEQIAEQLAALLPHMAPAGRLFWRSFGVAVHSPVLAQLRPTLVPEQDRVGWYLSQWVARAHPPDAPSVADPAEPSGFRRFLCVGSGYAPSNTLVDDAAVCLQLARHALRTSKDVAAFYREQGPRYDGFREALLPGRERLMRFGLPWQRCPAAWLSVGCGTARDLEYVLGHVRECGTRLWLLDLSPELLAVAQQRVDRLGLAHQVTLLVGDVNDETLPGLPPRGSLDLVSCSYCLSMIPRWRTALSAMVRALRVGGQLALVDFTCRSDAPNHWSQKLNQWWFANDGVFLSREHTAALQQHGALRTLWFHESERRVVYTPLHATTYLYVGLKVSDVEFDWS